MFNNIFEKIAERQLTTVTPLWKLNDMICRHHYEKIGAIVKYSNGLEGIDMVKVQASNLKANALFLGVIMPGAAILGRLLAKASSNNY